MYQKMQSMKFRTIRTAVLVVFTVMLSGVLQDAVCGEPVDFECEVFRLVNDERAIRGLPALAWNDLLFDAAQGHSIDMAVHDTMSHTGSSGSQLSDRISAAGYEFRACAENIAYNYVDPAAVVAGWMESRGHSQNILNENFCELGVGLAYSDSDHPYWTQNFGRPVSDCPAAGGSGCDDQAAGDADNEDAAIDDATDGTVGEETLTDTDAAGTGGSSSGTGGGGCFLSVAGIWP
jgi:hypothetical protein